MTENTTPTVTDLAQLVQDAQDAEPLRQAVIDALAIWDKADREAASLEIRYPDERQSIIAGRVRRLRAEAGVAMAERLRELHRVPIEQRELTEPEMAAAGFLPALVVVPDLDAEDEPTEPEPIEHTDQVTEWAIVDAEQDEQDERDREYTDPDGYDG